MRRIQRDVCHEEMIKRLTNGDTAIFREIWRLLLFAAAFGIYEGKRMPIDKVDSGKAIPDSYFSSPGWRGFLYLVGVAETNESDCLRSDQEQQDQLVTMFEEYTNQGLHSLDRRLQLTISPLDEIMNILLEIGSAEARKADLSDLI